MAKRKRRLTDPFTRTRGSRKAVESLSELRVGDVVRLLRGNYESDGGPRIGQSGIVRIAGPATGEVGVEFFRAFDHGHDLDGHSAEDGHGWWLYDPARGSRFTRGKERT